MKLILTCEHAGNAIPEKFKSVFDPFYAELNSHKGLDIGALDLFNFLKPLAAYNRHETTSRLLIELNRSLHHKDLFSPVSKKLPSDEKQKLIASIYKPYREAVEKVISDSIFSGEKVLHLSIHTFTPVWHGKERPCDMGILYDSKQKTERALAESFKSKLLEYSHFRIRFNYPYKGSSDGFTTYLRKKFPKNYWGIELEVNQKFATNHLMHKQVKEIIYKTVQSLTSTL